MEFHFRLPNKLTAAPGPHQPSSGFSWTQRLGEETHAEHNLIKLTKQIFNNQLSLIMLNVDDKAF